MPFRPTGHAIAAAHITPLHPVYQTAMWSALKPISRLCWRGGVCPGVLTQLQEFASSADSSLSQHTSACLSDSRAVVRLSGRHTIQFLQGMVTNDMRPLETAGAAPVYAAILTPKGKFLHDVMFFRQDDGSVLMDVDAQGKEAAMDWLVRYKLRKEVVVDDVSDQFSVWVQFGGASQQQQQAAPSEGRRGIQPRASQAHSGSSSDLQGTSKSGIAAAEHYRQWRYQQGVAEGEVEIPHGKAAPLDYNLDVLNGVSYTKGCYIGQERNSFTHYRGIIRKRCMPCGVQQDGNTQPEAGEAIVVDGTGEAAGNIQGVSGGLGLAYIKLKAALQSIDGKWILRGQRSGAVITPFRPAWWDPQWGFEEQGASEGPEQ